MRCPKCGYISFDHLETCTKCSKDLTAVVEKFSGGLVYAEAPQFLVMTPPSTDDFSETDSFQATEQDFDDDFLDEDLNVLLSDETDDDDVPIISLSDDDTAEESFDGSVDFDFSFDSEDEQEEVALAPESEGVELESPFSEEDETFTLSVPTELSDMSDLAPESLKDEGEVDFDFSLDDDVDDEPTVAAGSETGGFDLEELNLELDSVLHDAEGDGAKEEIELSLNDIEFSEMGLTGGAPALNPDGSVDMDADLDFELDLGGLSLHKKEEKV